MVYFTLVLDGLSRGLRDGMDWGCMDVCGITIEQLC